MRSRPLLRRSILAFALALTCALPRLAAAQAFTLGVRVDLATPSHPYGSAVADLNGDGRLDLVVTNNGANSVSVFMGAGGGAFGARTDFATGAGPQAVAIADVNGDGRLDLVVMNNSGNSISVLLGNGGGGFGAHVDYATGTGPSGIAVVDLNGDGRPDVAVSEYWTNSVGVFIANGSGGFLPRVDYPTGAGPTWVAAGDVNGDGVPDLAVTNASASSVSILLGTGGGVFGAKTDFTTGASPEAVAMADLNGDGKLDLAVANATANTVSILLGTGTGSFGAKTDFTTGSFPIAIAVADLNGDGKPDLAVADQSSNAISVLPGTGTGSFGAKTDFATGTPYSVSIADVNGDGRLDLVAPGYNTGVLSVLFGNGTAGGALFSARTWVAPGSNPLKVTALDLNGDGRPDLGVLTGSSLAVMLANGGAGSGFAPPINTPASFTSGYALVDVNGDGRPDFVAVNSYAVDVGVQLGDGTGHFGSAATYSAGSTPYGLALADFNGDGFPDMVVTDATAAQAHVLLNDGTGLFGAPSNLTVGTTPRAVAAADLNGDGRPDLVVVNYGANTISVLLATGSNTFAAKTDYAVGSSPNAIALADLNGDGRPDVVVSDYAGSAITVYLNNGSGGLVSRTDYATPSYPEDLAIGDLNGDGRADVALVSSGGASVFLGNGAGGLGPRTDYAVGSDPRGVAIADLNADGRLDLATADYAPNTASLLYAQEGTRTALAANPSPVVLGAPVTYTANVSVLAPGSGAASGSVSFFDGATYLGSAAVNAGAASLSLFASALGSRAISAAYGGDGRVQGSFAPAFAQRVVSTASAKIASIKDVANDQGRSVRLRFRASPFDLAGSGTPITQYEIFRQILPGLAPAGAKPAPGGSRAHPASVQLDGWDQVGVLAAHGDSAYDLVVPTLADSNSSGFHRTTLLVRADTGNPYLYYDSPPDSGYSVDNLPPAPPAPFTAVYAAGATHLHWDPNSEPDLWYYKVYRGTSGSFTPSAGNLIATRSDTGYVDVGSAGGYYALSAVDVNGNESGYTRLGPDVTLAVDAGPASFALAGVAPNPSVGGRLSVAFALPDGGRATLELLDVAGRRMAAREVGELGAGRHVVELAPSGALAPGLYLVRLTRAGERRVARVSVIE